MAKQLRWEGRGA